ncbi:Undefined function [Listeria monocytogenes N53-1]|nr:Undefined function [Listeria monocytogenes N53-1]
MTKIVKMSEKNEHGTNSIQKHTLRLLKAKNTPQDYYYHSVFLSAWALRQVTIM